MNAYNRADIIEINLTLKTYHQVGNLLFDTQASDQDPLTGFVYYFEWTDEGNMFAYWDPATGQNTIVRTYTPDPGIVSKRMAFAPDRTLYMMDNRNILYTIDLDTGNIASAGSVRGLQTGSFLSSGDMAFAPDGMLYVATGDYLFSVDIGTMMATPLYTNMLSGSSSRVWSGLAYCDGWLYASDAQVGSPYSDIFRIDPANGNVNQLIATRTLFNDLSTCPADIGPPVNRPPALDPIGDKFVLVGETLSFTVAASDPDGDDLTFTADVLPPEAHFDPATRVFSWTPTSAHLGVYPDVEVTVTDDDPDQPLSDTETFTITVANESLDVVVFADSFETGLGNWQTDAQNDWFPSTQRAVDGSSSAEVDGRAVNAQLISPPIDLQGRTHATITFSWFIETSLDSGEYLAFDVSTDGGSTWVEQVRLQGNVDQENLWHDVAVEMSDLVSLRLRFRASMSLYNEDANIDWITVTAM